MQERWEELMKQHLKLQNDYATKSQQVSHTLEWIHAVDALSLSLKVVYF